MNNEKDEYIQQLECVVQQMLTPLKSIPFSIVIKAMTGKEVIAFDPDKPEDILLLENLKLAAINVAESVATAGGIERPRPNEVGNDLEPYVERAIRALGYADVCSPTGNSGNAKAVGYPDRMFTDAGRRVYVEVKSFNVSTVDSTMRSFYFSPSDDFKVTDDGLHLMLSFGISKLEGKFFVNHWKVVTAHNLLVDVKYEFNSNNKRLYEAAAVLAEGDFDFMSVIRAS